MESCASQLISNFHFKPKVVLRYIDNIFMIWTHGEKSLTEFVNYAISTHRTIKLTSESNAESLVFVHTRVIIDSKIGPYPPSCTLNLLTWKSSYTCHQAHPNSPKTKVPHRQFLRLRWVCTKDSAFVIENHCFLNKYLRCGDPKHLIEKHLK
jgi:hypothetical protein